MSTRQTTCRALLVATCVAGVSLWAWGIRPRFKDVSLEESGQPQAQTSQPAAPGPAPAGAAEPPAPPQRPSASAAGETKHPGDATSSSDPVADVKAKVQALQQESLAVANRLRQDYPDNLDALGLVGKVRCRCGDTAHALECWEQCLRCDPSRDDFYDALATVALQKAEYEKAATWCRKGLEKNPQAPHLHGRLGEALSGLGRLAEAVPELERETGISPAYADGHFLLGQAYSLLHEQQKAKACLEAAIKLQPKDRRYHYELARVCTKLGLDEEAQRHTDDFSKLFQADWQYMTSHRGPYFDLAYAQQEAAETYGDAAALCCGRRNFAKGEELLTRAAALDPKKADYRARLALLFLQTGREAKAAEVCKQLIELEPNNAASHFNLGVVYARMGQFDAAKRMAQRALELEPDSPRCKRLYEQMQRAAK
jgi:tetratricopeptide (TPR) repeat protein